MFGNMVRRLLRRPWSIAVLVVLIALLAAAVLVARPDGVSLFGAFTPCFCP